jgi:hypothetical protein
MMPYQLRNSISHQAFRGMKKIAPKGLAFSVYSAFCSSGMITYCWFENERGFLGGGLLGR